MAIAQRLRSLDVFRGLTVFAMLLVCNLGELSPNYSPLLHAAWEHITPADLVFPFFLFILGVALTLELQPYSMSESGFVVEFRKQAVYARLARRAGILVLLGLLLNAFPDFDLVTWRLPGVLQRIAICYFVAALIVLHLPLRGQWSIGGLTLLGYSAILCFVDAPGVVAGRFEPAANLPRWVDLAVFSSGHLFVECPTDPEGLLSTPAAVVSVLIGCWVGRRVLSRPMSCRCGIAIIGLGVVCCSLGWVLSPIIPIIKVIWTPTFVLYAGGWAMICFGLCYLLTDAKPAGGWVWVALVFGRNAILAYVLSEAASDTLSAIDIRGTPFSKYVANSITNLSGGAISAQLSSLLYACLLTLAIWAICLVLYKRRWFLRV